MRNITTNNNVLLIGMGLLTMGMVIMCMCLGIVLLVMANNDDSEPEPTPLILVPTSFTFPTQQTLASATPMPTATATTRPTQQSSSGGTVNTPTGSYVTADSLNVRSGPDTANAVVGTLARYQTVTLTGRNANSTWLQIRMSNGTNGWVNATYIYAATAIANLPVVTTQPPALTLSTANGAETVVTANIANFPINTRVNIKLGTAPSTYDSTIYAANNTNGSGATTIVFSIPKTWSNGTPVNQTPLYVLATTENGQVSVWQTMNYSPSQPAISVSPTTGGAGTQVTLTASNFPPNVRVTIRIAPINAGGPGTTIVSTTTNGSGGVTATFALPANWEGGSPIIESNTVITAATDNWGASANVPFTYQPAIIPAITLSPVTGTAGIQIRVTGKGYPANTRVNIQFERAAMGILSEVFVAGNTDGSGNFDLSFLMPSAWSDGTKIESGQLMLVASTENRSAMVTSPFGYTAP